MAINTTEKQRRYYLFRHTGSGENIEWLSPNSGIQYSSDYHNCFLTPNKKVLETMVIHSDNETEDGTKFIYVIGAVDVTVSGLFPLEIVK